MSRTDNQHAAASGAGSSQVEDPISRRMGQLPSIDAMLQEPAVRAVCESFGRGRVTGWVRRAMEELRERVADNAVAADRGDLLSEAVRLLKHRAEEETAARLRHVINATGVVLHTNLGRAPLADAAVDAIHEAARYANLELDLTTGRRGKRGAGVEQLWRELTGAEAALVVNNCAAATWLALQTLAAGRAVVISRGQLIEIGGSYRLPDVFASAGVTLSEVGTTNRTRLADYERAITDRTAAVLRVHASNYRVSGFVENVPIESLVELARVRALVAIDDLGSGCLYDLSPYGFRGEPLVGDSLEAGADLVLFSGDKLLGGPQCGVILGKADLVDRMRANPLARAVRVDKLTLAALEATLRIHLAGKAFEEIPVLRCLAEPADRVRERAERVLAAVRDRAAALKPRLQSVESVVGGGCLPEQAMASWAIAVTAPSPQEFAAELRLGRPAVLSRIEEGAHLFDLRTVLPEEEELLIGRLAEL